MIQGFQNSTFKKEVQLYFEMTTEEMYVPNGLSRSYLSPNIQSMQHAAIHSVLYRYYSVEALLATTLVSDQL